ncbi:inositol polyphosphate multikinase [[Candida] anglica]|uniref:Kinase n=1 Tax=[Candida] anglica TaxID=148631 RepID=A0ABP0ECQ6_9ASCO
MNSVFVPTVHQAAGHKGSLTAENNGTVFAKLTSQQEIDFYTETQIITEDDTAIDDSPLGSHLSDWMPVYMGTLTKSDVAAQSLPASNPLLMDGIIPPIIAPTTTTTSPSSSTTGIPPSVDDKKYIVLQNLYYGYYKPSILDIKLGSILYDETASQEKKDRLQKVAESTTSGSLGFRICGMKVYHSSIDSPKPSINIPPIYAGIEESINVVPDIESQSVYLEFDKFYGRSLDHTNIKQGILLFFQSKLHSKLTLKLIENFLKRLQVLYNCVLESGARMIGSSLLFVFENDSIRWSTVEENLDRYDEFDPLLRDDFFADQDSDDEDEYSAPLSSLNIIDFAHSKYVKDKSHDESVCQGLENLIKVFEEIITDIKSNTTTLV